MPAVICIQHCIGDLNSAKKVRKTNESYSSGKGRIKLLSTDNVKSSLWKSHSNYWLSLARCGG